MKLQLKYVSMVLFVISILVSQKAPITVGNLSQKWSLEKYSYLFFSEEPAEIEKEDYILLKKDMSFESISEGVYDQGKWRLDAKQKRIYLSNEEEGALVFIVQVLEKDKLILSIDDPTDEDTKNLKVHFKNSKL